MTRKSWIAGEASNELFGHAVGKVFLGWIAREVFQRQYRQGLDGGLWGILRAASAIDHPREGNQCQRDYCPERQLYAG